MTLGVGTRLGAYEIVAAVGKGGFGEVYKARDTRLGRSVAIKVLPSADPDLRGRFDREARTIAALQHPNICALYDVGRHEAADYLVLEFLEGETLADRVRRGPLPLDEAVAIAIAIASALDRAHRAGIVHRDLKPENVMLTRSGPKLLDFGLAKLRHPGAAVSGLSAAATAASPVITAQGTIVGTLHYMSPEQINGEDADARSDIWAFGCVLYEMLTGRKAFEGSSPASLIAAIMNAVPPRVSTRSPLTPPSVDRVIATCLTADPDKRFHSAHDLGLQLQWIAAGAADATAARRRPRARYAAWAAAAGILMAIVLIARGLPRPAIGEQAPISFLVRSPEGAPFPLAPMFLTVSPDGRALAFVAGEVDVGQRLYIQPMNSTDARALQGTENVDQPFWSADSRAIAFSDRLTSKLKRVDVAGGPSRTIADVPGGQTLQGGTWNQNGDILFAVIGGGNPIFRVPATGGVPVPVTTLDRAAGELAHIWPHFLPDGEHFLYAVPNSRPDRSGLFVASLKTPGAMRVSDAMSNAVYSDPGFLLFVRDETLLAQRFDLGRMALLDEPVVVTDRMGTGAGNGRAAFAASRNGVVAYRPQGGGVYTTTLTWFDRSGRVLGTVGSPNLHRAIAVSPDATRVAAQVGWTVGSDIWVADSGRGIFTRLTSDPSNEEWPVWSPDGARIAFASNRDGSMFNIYDMPADGSAAPRLMFQSDRNSRPVQWSRDGRWLLVDANGIFALRLDGDRTQIPIGPGNHPAEFAKISPDGEWIAYASDDTGRLEIYLQRFPTPTGRWPISSNGGTRPHWRGDGHELYYLGFDNQLYAVALTPGSPPAIGSAKRLFPVRLTSAPRGATMFDGIEPAADGQRFLVNLAAEGATSPEPVTVRVNWPSALKK
jgi:eukaryotic-like serine/threonine-protein kinase